MEKSPRYRHELKYSISRAEHLALRSRLRAVMQTDPHTDSSGLYRIRSIYFDNYRDKALKEKINGSPQRGNDTACGRRLGHHRRGAYTLCQQKAHRNSLYRSAESSTSFPGTTTCRSAE